MFLKLFPLWAPLAALLGFLLAGPLAEWGGAIVPLLTVVMLCMGLTLRPRDFVAVGKYRGAFLTGMVSVGIGEVTISQLTRKGLPIAVAAATSVLVVITTVVFASTTLFAQMIKNGGWAAVSWNLLCYDIPGVLIGGQIGPRLQGRVSPHAMRRAISVLFVLLSIAMMFVALRKLGIL